jgi:hypothetical protein
MFTTEENIKLFLVLSGVLLIIASHTAVKYPKLSFTVIFIWMFLVCYLDPTKGD